VVVPNSHGPWVELTAQMDIEQVCLQENERFFRQANNSPFMIPPISEVTGHMGMGPAANSILRGNFIIPSGTDEYATKLIHHLRLSPCVLSSPPVSTIITTNEHIRIVHPVAMLSL